MRTHTIKQNNHSEANHSFNKITNTGNIGQYSKSKHIRRQMCVSTPRRMWQELVCYCESALPLVNHASHCSHINILLSTRPTQTDSSERAVSQRPLQERAGERATCVCWGSDWQHAPVQAAVGAPLIYPDASDLYRSAWHSFLPAPSWRGYAVPSKASAAGAAPSRPTSWTGQDRLQAVDPTLCTTLTDWEPLLAEEHRCQNHVLSFLSSNNDMEKVPCFSRVEEADNCTYDEIFIMSPLNTTDKGLRASVVRSDLSVSVRVCSQAAVICFMNHCRGTLESQRGENPQW